MKKQLLLLAGMLCFVVTAWAAPTAKAIYCAANTTLYFTYDEVTYNTSTAYEQLDGKTPTNIYNNISSTGYDHQEYYERNGRVYTRILYTPWVKDDNWKNITTVKFLENLYEWKPTKLDGYFFNMQFLTTIVGGKNLNVSEVTSLYETFCQCYKLANLQELSEWDVSKVETLESTFQSCRDLTDIGGISNWNISNVINYNSTFSSSGINDLTPIANWNVTNALSLNSTFSGTKITSLESLANWDISNVESMNSTFSSCSNLKSLEGLENWPVSNVNSMQSTFSYSGITNTNALSGWDISSVDDLTGIFQGANNLTDISGLSEWDISNVNTLNSAFYTCTSLTNVDDISEWNTSNVTNISSLFGNCTALENIEGIRTWDVSNVITTNYTFGNCSSLESLEPIYNWNLQKCEDFYMMFTRCISLTGHIDLSNWDLSNVSYSYSEELGAWKNLNHFRSIFSGCSNVKGITFGKGTLGAYNLLDFYNETAYPSYRNDYYQPFATFSGMFSGCSSLRYIDFSGCTDPYGNLTAVDRDGVLTKKYKNNATYTTYDPFYNVPRTCVIYLPSGNGQPDNYNEEDEVSNLENVVYTASDETLQCDKYYSEDKVDIELPHRFHADLATYERTFNSNYGGVILPYPVKINDNDEDEFQPFLLQREFKDHMFFKGIAEVPANTPFCFKRKQASTDMTFRMEDLWVESTYDISGETSDNIEEGFAWKAQGFYVNNVIEPENGTFSIPTMDDYVGTETVDYEVDHVYYLSKNRFYRCDDATLTLAPHRILFYGLWEKYSGTDPEKSGSFDFEELGDEVVDAIQAAETDMDEAKAAAIYDANGNRLSKTQHGLNILRMSDGSVKKVIKK